MQSLVTAALFMSAAMACDSNQTESNLSINGTSGNYSNVALNGTTLSPAGLNGSSANETIIFARDGWSYHQDKDLPFFVDALGSIEAIGTNHLIGFSDEAPRRQPALDRAQNNEIDSDDECEGDSVSDDDLISSLASLMLPNEHITWVGVDENTPNAELYEFTDGQATPVAKNDAYGNHVVNKDGVVVGGAASTQANSEPRTEVSKGNVVGAPAQDLVPVVSATGETLLLSSEGLVPVVGLDGSIMYVSTNALRPPRSQAELKTATDKVMSTNKPASASGVSQYGKSWAPASTSKHAESCNEAPAASGIDRIYGSKKNATETPKPTISGSNPKPTTESRSMPKPVYATPSTPRPTYAPLTPKPSTEAPSTSMSMPKPTTAVPSTPTPTYAASTPKPTTVSPSTPKPTTTASSTPKPTTEALTMPKPTTAISTPTTTTAVPSTPTPTYSSSTPKPTMKAPSTPKATTVVTSTPTATTGAGVNATYAPGTKLPPTVYAANGSASLANATAAPALKNTTAVIKDSVDVAPIPAKNMSASAPATNVSSVNASIVPSVNVTSAAVKRNDSEQPATTNVSGNHEHVASSNGNTKASPSSSYDVYKAASASSSSGYGKVPTIVNGGDTKISRGSSSTAYRSPNRGSSTKVAPSPSSAYDKKPVAPKASAIHATLIPATIAPKVEKVNYSLPATTAPRVEKSDYSKPATTVAKADKSDYSKPTTTASSYGKSPSFVV